MGLVALKFEFRCLTNLEATAANARYFLSSIGLPTWGYDFRTIASWTELVETIEIHLDNLNPRQPEPEPELQVDEESVVEKEIVKIYKTTKLNWKLVKLVDRINSFQEYKLAKRRFSIWLHPDRNKDKLASYYMSIFNNILDIIKTKIA